MSAKLTSAQKRAIRRAAMPQNIGRRAVVNGRQGIHRVALASPGARKLIPVSEWDD